ncbi:MAG TPA: CHAD domain-containing protein [Candidatus Kapabacteria bacterium]
MSVRIHPIVLSHRSAADVVRAACTEALVAMIRYRAQTIRFQEEPIHQMRVGTRRLRAMLRVFASIMDEEWASVLESELQWLAKTLGAARDLDVLRNRLNEAAKIESLMVQRAVKTIDALLAKRHRDAKQAMKEALKSKRYETILERLHEAQLAPQLTPEAEGPALDVLLPALRNAWKKLVRKADALKQKEDALEFHAVRKSGKRLRYATELLLGDFDPPLQKQAEKFIGAMKKVQDILGELQDATVALVTVQQIEDRAESKRTSYESLVKMQKKFQAKSRKEFPRVWKKAEKEGNKKWMGERP